MKKIILLLLAIGMSAFFASQAIASAMDTHVAADDSDRKLVYKNNVGEIFGVWNIAVSRHTPRLPVKGYITEIIVNPSWRPTGKTIAAAAKKGRHLKNYYNPGETGNAMGNVKFIVDSGGKLDKNFRMHATDDENSIGKNVSRGCIRMRKIDGLVLASFLTGHSYEYLKHLRGETRIKLKTPVEFYYQK